MSLTNGFNSTERQNLWPFQIESIASDNSNVNQKLKFALGMAENIVRKGENAGYQHFLLFPQCFQKASSVGSLKVEIVWLRVK